VTLISFGLYDMISEWGEENVRSLISSFKCSLDQDAESFLKDSSIRHEKKGISRTYLLFEKGNSEDDLCLAGYYTLAIKCFMVNEERKMPIEMFQKMNVNRGIAQAYLLGQLAKADGVEKGFGRIMMDDIMKIFGTGYRTYGCRTVRLDCKNEPKLIEYYESHGFISLGVNSDNALNQMVVIM
jgi:hypothetical protein